MSSGLNGVHTPVRTSTNRVEQCSIFKPFIAPEKQNFRCHVQSLLLETLSRRSSGDPDFTTFFLWPATAPQFHSHPKQSKVPRAPSITALRGISSLESLRPEWVTVDTSYPVFYTRRSQIALDTLDVWLLKVV